MEINISIDGVVRNTIDKFNYHYVDAYLDDYKVDDSIKTFSYGIKTPVLNDDLLKYYNFNDVDEYENFLFLEYPVEIFGHAFPSYTNVSNDLNKLIFENSQHNFHLFGLNEYGKAKPATLFFLSKIGFLGNSIKFIYTADIKKEWKKCDIWITDNFEIIKNCPKNKKAIKFNTKYNSYFENELQINKFTEIYNICNEFSTKITS